MKTPLFLLTLLFVVSSATAQRTDTLRTETTTEDARIGQYAYFDINAGPEMLLQNSNGKSSFSVQLNALIGFGW